MSTGMERFAALMSGQIPDRVPIVCNMPDQGARELGVPLRELSMGMSSDLAAAVAEGSTLVRIGTALYGARGSSQ